MIHRNNYTVLDLKKVSYATLIYRRKGSDFETNIKPSQPTVNGSPFNHNAIAPYIQGYEGETEYERAVRLDVLDKWYPVCKLQLTNGHSLEFVNNKAITMWNSWKAKVYGKRKINSLHS